MTIELNDEQNSAAECLDRPVLVTAGAGSGKTRMLTQRFVNAILPGRVKGWESARLDQVLAITFTEKAAGEIARRVRSALVSAEMREEALEITDAWISTIHGLCTRILRRHAFEAEVDPQFTVLDAVQAGRHREAAFEGAARTIFAADPLAVGLLNEYDAGTVFQAVVAIARELGVRGLTGADIELEHAETAAQLLGETRGLFDRGRISCELGYSGTSEAPREHAELCEELLGKCSRLVAAGREERALLEDLMETLVAYKPLRKLKGLEGFAEELSVAKDALIGRVAAALVAPYATELVELASEFARCYEAGKALAGALDFDDLQIKTVALLERRPDLAQRYRTQFRAVMVDEFQDTDGLQLRLVELLSNGNLCTVGDEQQSIYRFRGADVEVYREHRTQMIDGGALVAELGVNYRSHPEVLGFINGVFASDEYFGPNALKLLSPPGPRPHSRFEAIFCDQPRAEAVFVDSTDLDGASARVAEAECVASRLKQLIALGAMPGDAAVLLRTYTHAAAYADALSRHDVPAVVVGGSRFFGLSEIAIMRALNRAIANVEDGTALGLLLTSDFAPLSSDALAILKFGSGARDARSLGVLLHDRACELESSDREVAERLTGVLDRGYDRIGRLPLAKVLLMAVEESGWDLRLLSQGNVGRDAFANVVKFARQAAEFEASEGSGPAAFAVHLDARERVGDTETPASLSDDGSQAVRIMSVHASKGLEFPIVFVPELAWQGGGKGPCVRIHNEAPGRLSIALNTPADDEGEARPGSTWVERFSRLDAQAEDDERSRVLYVACTRAQEALIVSGAMRLRPKQASRAKHHAARLTRVLGVELPVAGASDEPRPVPGSDTMCRVRIVEASKIAASPGAARTEAQRAVLRIAPQAGEVIASGARSITPTRLSYTQLEEFERCPKRFWVRRVLGVRPMDEAGSASAAPLRFGTALHTALRLVTAEGGPPSPGRLSAIAAQTGLGAEEAERLRAAVTGYCRSEIARRAGAGAVVRRECPFNIRVGDEFLLTGSIDLYSRTGESALVVDYKSGATGESSELEQRYRLQGTCYALAALRDGCTTVQVEFVRPEFLAPRGGIQSVSYAFTAKDARTIQEELLRRHREIGESPYASSPSRECERCDVPACLCEERSRARG